MTTTSQAAITREQFDNILEAYWDRAPIVVFYYNRVDGPGDNLWFVDFYRTRWEFDQDRRNWLYQGYFPTTYVGIERDHDIDHAWEMTNLRLTSKSPG